MRLFHPAAACLAFGLLAQPATAADLGLDLDLLLQRLDGAATASGATFKAAKLACAENPMPGNADQRIVSCTHSLGGGKMLITNAATEGPLIDIATQTWAGGEDGPAVDMIAWLAAAANDAAPGDYRAPANALVSDATANDTATANLGKASFFVMAMGGELVIAVSGQD